MQIVNKVIFIRIVSNWKGLALRGACDRDAALGLRKASPVPNLLDKSLVFNLARNYTHRECAFCCTL